MEISNTPLNFIDWFESKFDWEKLRIRRIITDRGGYSRGGFYHFLKREGGTDIVKNLSPAVKDEVIAVFPDAKEVLYPETQNEAVQ